MDRTSGKLLGSWQEFCKQRSSMLVWRSSDLHCLALELLYSAMGHLIRTGVRRCHMPRFLQQWQKETMKICDQDTGCLECLIQSFIDAPVSECVCRTKPQSERRVSIAYHMMGTSYLDLQRWHISQSCERFTAEGLPLADSEELIH